MVLKMNVQNRKLSELTPYPGNAKKHDKKVYAVVGNMSVALERRDFMKSTDCLVCNLQEAGLLFFEDYSGKKPEEMADILAERITAAQIPGMIVTMGADGAVYANLAGEKGYCPARRVDVVDTTGAGDCMSAVFASRILMGDGVEAAGRFACAAASYGTMFPGAWAGDLSVEKVHQLLKTEWKNSTKEE